MIFRIIFDIFQRALTSNEEISENQKISGKKVFDYHGVIKILFKTAPIFSGQKNRRQFFVHFFIDAIAPKMELYFICLNGIARNMMKLQKDKAMLSIRCRFFFI